MSDAILRHIPVTTSPRNVTYANVFCAICHGQTDFKFWNVKITNMSNCLVNIIASLLTGTPGSSKDHIDDVKAWNASMLFASENNSGRVSSERQSRF